MDGAFYSAKNGRDEHAPSVRLRERATRPVKRLHAFVASRIHASAAAAALWVAHAGAGMCIIVSHPVGGGNDLTAESVSCLSSSDGEPFGATGLELGDSSEAMCYGRPQNETRAPEDQRGAREASSGT